jgi:hypothetical protein
MIPAGISCSITSWTTALRLEILVTISTEALVYTRPVMSRRIII